MIYGSINGHDGINQEYGFVTLSQKIRITVKCLLLRLQTGSSVWTIHYLGPQLGSVGIGLGQERRRPEFWKCKVHNLLPSLGRRNLPTFYPFTKT